MPNHASLDSQGIIRPVLEGDQDETTVSQLISKTTALLKEVQEKQRSQPIRFLVDMTNVGGQTLGARKVGVKALRTMPYQKIAIVGANRIVRHTTSLLIMASGQDNKVKQFADEASAAEWLARS